MNSLQVGDIVSFRDHFTLHGTNPLFGVNDERWGRRFPDMGQAYSSDLRSKVRAQHPIEEVVAAMLNSRYLNSLHEAKFASSIGAHVLVNGIVPEVIVARHVRVNCLSLCVIDQAAYSTGTAPITSEQLSAAHNRIVPLLESILS